MNFRPLFRRATASVVLGALATVSAGFVTPVSSVASAEPPSHIIPLSASTCSDSVCIYVTGTGLNVSNWTTTAVISHAMCSTPSFLVNGVVRKTGVSTCGSANAQLGSVWSNPGNFPNGTVLCNTWSGISGEPCATVHS
jgi:hypothetical protein